MLSGIAAWKHILAASHQVKQILTKRHHHPTLTYLSKRSESLCPHRTCMQIFRAASLFIAQIQKQPKYPSTSERTNTPCYMRIIFLSNTKEWAGGAHTTWTNLSGVRPSERSQTQKTMIHLHHMFTRQRKWQEGGHWLPWTRAQGRRLRASVQGDLEVMEVLWIYLNCELCFVAWL